MKTARLNNILRTALSTFALALTCALVPIGTAAQTDISSDDPVVIFNQAQDLHEKGDLTGAIRLYEKAIAILKDFPEGEYQRAAALLALGKTDDALAGFRRAAELKTDWSLPLANIGSILVDRGEYDQAQKALEKAVDLDPQNPQTLTALTDLRINTKAPAEVRQKLLEKISLLTPKANATAALWTAKAALETSLDKRPAARASLNRALALDPNNRPALFQDAGLALADGDVDRAKNIVATLEKTGHDKDGLSLLKASIFAREGNSDEALKQLAAIAHPNAAATDLKNRIIAASSTDTAEVENQLAADPKNSSILGRLCNLYRKDDPAKALDYCRQASAVEPNNVDHAIGFAAALVRAKQYEQAVNLLRRMIEIAPDNWTAHANLATALFQLTRYAEAKTEYQWLSAKQPKAPTPYFFLGIVHDHLGEYLDAMANYQEYLRLADPVQNKLDIERVNLRLPSLEKDIKLGKGKKK
jgi:tetratricopeptide (TPR) repeat protein